MSTEYKLNGIDENEIPRKSQNFITYQAALAETDESHCILAKSSEVRGARCGQTYLLIGEPISIGLYRSNTRHTNRPVLLEV